jgi:hypothetical protein
MGLASDRACVDAARAVNRKQRAGTAAARAEGVSKNRRAVEALRRGLGMDQVERSELARGATAMGQTHSSRVTQIPIGA